MELGPGNRVYQNPQHPYTQALISAIPNINPSKKSKPVLLQGEVPSPVSPPSGCVFHPRCQFSEKICSLEKPPLLPKKNGHLTACHL